MCIIKSGKLHHVQTRGAGLMKAMESFELRGLNPSKSTMSNKKRVSSSILNQRIATTSTKVWLQLSGQGFDIYLRFGQDKRGFARLVSLGVGYFSGRTGHFWVPTPLK
jgi:hypothetical protein